MKVNMNLIPDTESTPGHPGGAGITPPGPAAKEPDTADEIDESNKNSKIKTVLLLLMMIGGFALFVCNMTHLVNNMRLDNQGSATEIVYEMDERLEGHMGSDGSGSVPITDSLEEESGVSTDAARDGPEAPASDEGPSYANESEEMAALRQRTKEAENEAEFVKRQLKNAEEMLDYSLTENERLQNELSQKGT